MIKVIDSSNPEQLVLMCDSKDEVPATGAETKAEDWDNAIPPFSMIMSVKKEVGCLNSSDTWDWGD